MSLAGPAPIETRGRSPPGRLNFWGLGVPAFRVPRVRGVALGLLPPETGCVVFTTSLVFDFVFLLAASAGMATSRTLNATIAKPMPCRSTGDLLDARFAMGQVTAPQSRQRANEQWVGFAERIDYVDVRDLG